LCSTTVRLASLTERWRKWHNEDIQNFFLIKCLDLSIKTSNKCGAVAWMKKAKDIYKTMVRKSDGNNPFVKPRRT